MNSTSAQGITVFSTKYIIRRVVFTNASISLDTAAGGVYAESGATTQLVNTAQAYSALTSSAKFVDGTLNANATANVRTETTIYLKLATPQGAAATCDIYVIGDKLD